MLFSSAILAGFCIAIAASCYLVVGGIAGAILFACGLIEIIQFNLKLFTGFAGFYLSGEEKDLFIVLIGNIVGCIIGAFIFGYNPVIKAAASVIVATRLSYTAFDCFLMSIGCGFLMTGAVYGARKGNYLPLLFGIPVFILTGMPHCIADAFYICVAGTIDSIEQIIFTWIGTIFGNYIGCNLIRLSNKIEY